jgi:hypothetical protein
MTDEKTIRMIALSPAVVVDGRSVPEGHYFECGERLARAFCRAGHAKPANGVELGSVERRQGVRMNPRLMFRSPAPTTRCSPREAVARLGRLPAFSGDERQREIRELLCGTPDHSSVLPSSNRWPIKHG